MIMNKMTLRYMNSPLHKIGGNEIMNEDTPVHDDQTVRDDDTLPSPQSLNVEEQIQEENLEKGHCKKETSVRLCDYVTNTYKKKSSSHFTPPAQSRSSVAASKQWELHQMNVHNAFLYGDLEEEVFMKLPPSLNKDYSLFTLRQNGVQLNVLVYVDDLIISGNDSKVEVTNGSGRVKDNKEKDKIRAKPDKIKSKREAWKSPESSPTKSKPTQNQESIKWKKIQL
nr:hypothetical protein [Tanacetum cinerariifolium]